MATPSRSRHVLPGALGPLLLDVRTSDRTLPRPAVVIIHGFKGFKDWGMFPALAERVARAGFTAVSVNLSGSGVDNTGECVWPDRFRRNTYSSELADIARVIDALGDGSLELPPSPHVGLVGHSRGGGMAILTARRDPRVQALVTWAAFADVQRWHGREADWRLAGHVDVTNARTGQRLELGTTLLDDIEQNGTELDLLAAAGRLPQPWLLLHGTADEAVPVAEGRALAATWHGDTSNRMHLIEGAGHTFGAVHPFAGMTPELAEAFDETLKWLGRHL